MKTKDKTFSFFFPIINKYIQQIKEMKDEITSKNINIYIRLYNGNGCSLKIQQNKTIKQLITTVNSLSLELPSTYQMMVKGKNIRDFNKTLKESNFYENSIVHIVEIAQQFYRNEKMDVCIYFNNEKFIIKSNANQTILDLKKNIYRLIKIYPKDQMLLFNGIFLKNENTLLDYKIKTDALICLHSFALIDTFDDILSDYDQNAEYFLKNDSNLLESVLSLNYKTSMSKTALFRSDSMGSKVNKQLEPYEIQIRQKHGKDDEINSKQFNYALFSSFGLENVSPIAFSPKINILDSDKIPSMSMRFDNRTHNNKFFHIEQQVNVESYGSLTQSLTEFQRF